MSSNDFNSTRRPRVILMVVCAAVVVAGSVTWAFCAGAGDADRAWRAMLVNFLYFFPLSVAMTVWPAIIFTSRGQWQSDRMRQVAFSAITFAPVAAAMFVLLILGREHWATWVHTVLPPREKWLSPAFVFIRDGGGMVLMWVLSVLYVRGVRRGTRPVQLGGWLVLSYTVVLTLIGFDMIMSLSPVWYSALFGAYFFIGSAFLGLVAWTFAALITNPRLEDRRKHDLGKLMVAFGLLTMYMMYSQLIVIWYENLPKEVPYVIPRLNLPPWRWVGLAILLTVYLGPLVFLLLRWSKLNTWYLGGFSLVILVMIWVERWWLVAPTLGGACALGWPELSLAAACTAALVLGMAVYLGRHWPKAQESP